jgi:hypothetical protein
MAAVFSQLQFRFVESDLNQPCAELRFLSKTTKPYTVFAIYTDESTALMSFNVAPSHS